MHSFDIPEGICFRRRYWTNRLRDWNWFTLELETLSGSVTAFDSSRQLISINTTASLEKNNTIAVGGSKSGTIANISTLQLVLHK